MTMLGQWKGLFSWTAGERGSAQAAASGASPSNPRARFFEAVDEIAWQERLPFHIAMARARADRPKLFQAAFPLDAQAGTGRRCGEAVEAAFRSRSPAPMPELLAA
jgi:hypothetical protein